MLVFALTLKYKTIFRILKKHKLFYIFGWKLFNKYFTLIIKNFLSIIKELLLMVFYKLMYPIVYIISNGIYLYILFLNENK